LIAGEVLPLAVILALIALIAVNVKWSFIATLDFPVVWRYAAALWRGLYTTLGITFVSLALGLVAGILLAIAYRTGGRAVRSLVIAHTELWRNTPLLIQVLWIHFALPTLTGVSTSILVSGTLALTLQASAYLAEVVRGGIAAVPRSQWDAAHSLGLGTFPTWMRVILPQAIKLMIPPLVNTSFSFFKGSTILSIIGVSELMKMGSIISVHSHKPIEIFTTVGLIYLIIGFIFSRLGRLVEKYLSN